MILLNCTKFDWYQTLIIMHFIMLVLVMVFKNDDFSVNRWEIRRRLDVQEGQGNPIRMDFQVGNKNSAIEGKGNPIIYTYIDRSEPYFNEVLLQLWLRLWKDFGWDVATLTPETAKTHEKYDEFTNLLNKAGICCLPRQTYMRFLAMSNIGEGGFFSEVHLFPLKNAMSMKLGDFPNDGQFTSYDGNLGSFLSGSNKEWNRMVNLLMMNIDRNVVISLRRIIESNSKQFHRLNQVESCDSFLTVRQFEYDMCERTQDKIAIRFNPFSLEEIQHPRYDRGSIPALVNSFSKIYTARCLRDRPLVFTFFEPVEYLPSANSMIEIWRETWSLAGWEPVVLNLEDAKRHPNFLEYSSNFLTQGKQFKDGRDRLNFLCFSRWFAVAASGGFGWMSDIDTFPLHIQPSIPNEGQLTGHNFIVPNLVSGSAKEWNRIANLIYINFWKNQKESDETESKVQWSDMVALKQLFLADESTFFVQKYTREISEFYSEEILQNIQISDIYNLKDKCHLADSIMSVHISTFSCRKIGFCQADNEKEEFSKQYIAKKWLESFRAQCLHLT